MTGGTPAAGAAESDRARPIAAQTVDELLAALADGTPTPAGGAACAVVAATAAGLAGMATRVTARRSGDARWTLLASSADELRRTLLALADRDAEAYRGVIEARRPGGSRPRAAGAADKRESPHVIVALRVATDVPLAVARASLEVLTLCGELAGAVPSVVASDVAVAVSLARAAVEGSVTTARANVVELDPESAEKLQNELADLEAKAAGLGERIVQTMERRG
ncbi:MAG: cyclodeaminase/cyclohydrolase family protein [Candidatus Rokubacteria bacterium]|nr:cyclodeaminase/cyclohydrolase family protein [Candidatus Rokubacteria bacterium]